MILALWHLDELLMERAISCYTTLPVCTIQVANLVNYNCHPLEHGNKCEKKKDSRIFFVQIMLLSQGTILAIMCIFCLYWFSP